MKQFDGYKSEAPSTKFPMLPAGTYVAGIKNVKIDGKEPDQQLVLRLDIIEGEWAGYYTKRYERDSQNARDYQAKYKGDFRLQIPDPSNPKRSHPEWDTKAFNNAMWAIEHSNPGYKWDWNEGSLKGKIVGINVREGSFNGNVFTQIGRLEVADDVRKGIIETMKPRAPRSDATEPATDPGTGYFIATDEVPF